MVKYSRGRASTVSQVAERSWFVFKFPCTKTAQQASLPYQKVGDECECAECCRFLWRMVLLVVVLYGGSSLHSSIACDGLACVRRHGSCFCSSLTCACFA